MGSNNLVYKVLCINTFLTFQAFDLESILKVTVERINCIELLNLKGGTFCDRDRLGANFCYTRTLDKCLSTSPKLGHCDLISGFMA